jgi:hypothetical protein
VSEAPTVNATDERKGERRIGVVFVHGVGEQKQSSTIREQGGPLLDWIWGWHNARDLPADKVLQPEWAKLSYGEPLVGPARFSIHLPEFNRPAYPWETPGDKHWDGATWVLAEGWWATRLEAPSMVTMLTWSVRILGRFWVGLWNEAIRRTHDRLGHHAAGGAALGEFWERIGNVLLVGAEIPLAIISYPLVVLLLIIAQIPIDQLQKFILLTLIRPLLVDRVGDFWIYLHDYPGAMHIRRGVEAAIDALADGPDHCTELVVIAHSQGAVVAFDALTSGGIKNIGLIRRFITVGGALNKAWSLEEGVKALAAPLPKTLTRWVDLWANYDPVPGGPLRKRFPGILVSERLTNAINVLTDHDSYWRNPEQFLSRLAQEIDAPEQHGAREDPTSSRFWPGTDRQAVLVDRRADRVHVLVFWRCVAFFLFLGAVVARGVVGPGAFARGERLVLDGRGIWSALRAVPGLDAALKPVEALGAWVDRILGNVGWSFEPIGMAIVALVGFGAIAEISYLIAQLVWYRAWDTRETDDVAQPLGKWRTGDRNAWWRVTLGALVVAVPGVAIAIWP